MSNIITMYFCYPSKERLYTDNKTSSRLGEWGERRWLACLPSFLPSCLPSSLATSYSRNEELETLHNSNPQFKMNTQKSNLFYLPAKAIIPYSKKGEKKKPIKIHLAPTLKLILVLIVVGKGQTMGSMSMNWNRLFSLFIINSLCFPTHNLTDMNCYITLSFFNFSIFYQVTYSLF